MNTLKTRLQSFQVAANLFSLRALCGLYVLEIVAYVVAASAIAAVTGRLLTWYYLLAGLLGVASALFVALAKKPWYLTASKFDCRPGPMAAALVLGFTAANVVRIVDGHAPSPFVLSTHHVVLFVMIGIVGPIAEELLDRGIYLSTLLGRLPALPALLIISLAEAVNHHALVPALISEMTISAVYIFSRRSLSASVACHVTVNILAFFPSALLIR